MHSNLVHYNTMATAATYAHVVKEWGQPARLEKHPRVRVAMIVADYLAYGWSVDEMHRQHPHLGLSELHGAMAYFYDHEQEITDELAAELATVDRLRSMPRPPVWFKLQAKGLIK